MGAAGFGVGGRDGSSTGVAHFGVGRRGGSSTRAGPGGQVATLGSDAG